MPNIPEIKIGNTTYKLKDGDLREHIVENNNSQPSNENNRIWIKSSQTDVQIPTWDEFSDVNNALADSNLPISTFFDKSWNNHKTVYLNNNQDFVQFIKVTNESTDAGYMGFDYYVNGTLTPGGDNLLVPGGGSVIIELPMPVNTTDIRYIVTKNSNGRNCRFNLMYDTASLIAGNTSLINSVKDEVDRVEFLSKSDLVFNDTKYIDTYANGWKLVESSGLCISDGSYKLVKYRVVPGEIVKITTNGMFQFQTVASVPSSGRSNRVGQTYMAGMYVLTVPDTATYIIVSILIDGGTSIVFQKNGIPDYFVSNVESAMTKIKNNMMEVGRDGETFIFITDIHWETNNKHSQYLIEYLLKNLNINVLLCGGDLINEGTKDAMSETMRECVTSYSRIGNIVMPCAFGNHDSNKNNQTEETSRHFSFNDQYALMQKQAEEKVTYITSDTWNFYFDAPTTKTRFIVIDTGTWGGFYKYGELVSAMMSVDTGWHIVVMGHWFYNNGSRSDAIETIMDITDEYNNRGSYELWGTTYNFENAKGIVSLILGGHVHKDMSWTTEDGVPVVLSDCDSGLRTSNPDYPYVYGTITEQAFDVITINYTTGTVKAVRVGRGADRNWIRNLNT